MLGGAVLPPTPEDRRKVVSSRAKGFHNKLVGTQRCAENYQACSRIDHQ
jgi:hypothetical protein